ncbi:MAG: SpoIIE family protein phosphatase [Bacteroidetes bacterium]|nr:SpoIIE family protein phosphatase [Bacteroidota bacterium]
MKPETQIPGPCQRKPEAKAGMNADAEFTTRIATEATLSLNEKRFETLFRAFPIPSYFWQRKGDDFILFECNDADQALTHSMLRNFIGQSLHFLYPEGGIFRNDIERCYREKSRFNRELPGYHLRTTVEVKDLVINYIWVEPDLVLSIIEDVTAKRAVNNELKKLSSAVEQTADAVFITNSNGIIEYVNPGFEHITGYTGAEALGKTPGILKSGTMPLEYYQRMWSTILSGETFRAQTVNRRHDGALLVVEQTITPMKDHLGNITNFVSVLKDMTERIRLQEQETEQRLAGLVQKNLFPSQSPKISGYDIAGAVFPAETMSGDYFDYITMPDNTTTILVADVSGHGMGPALIMTDVRAYLRLITHYHSEPRLMLSKLNELVVPDLAEDNNFITMFLANLDPKLHILKWANAGNWPVFIMDREGRILDVPSTNDVPIGILPNPVFSLTEPVRLEPGFIAIFLTDGIPEANDIGSQEFGISRMLEIVRRFRNYPASDIINRVREEVQRFMEPIAQKDDQTLIICKRLDQPYDKGL